MDSIQAFAQAFAAVLWESSSGEVGAPDGQGPLYVGRSGTTETIPEEDFGEGEGVGGAQELARQCLLSAIDDEEYRENTADLYRQLVKWKMHRGSALRKAVFHTWRMLVPRRA